MPTAIKPQTNANRDKVFMLTPKKRLRLKPGPRPAWTGTPTNWIGTGRSVRPGERGRETDEDRSNRKSAESKRIGRQLQKWAPPATSPWNHWQAASRAPFGTRHNQDGPRDLPHNGARPIRQRAPPKAMPAGPPATVWRARTGFSDDGCLAQRDHSSTSQARRQGPAVTARRSDDAAGCILRGPQ